MTAPSTTSTTTLPALSDQAETLVAHGLHEFAGWSADELREHVRQHGKSTGLLALRSDLVPVSALATLVEVRGRSCFVVTDMTDVDEFTPVVPQPDSPVYLLTELDRGDAMANWSPTEAEAGIVAAGRSPLTLAEGLHWLLQQPEVLQRGRCFMTIGARLRRPSGALDARTPAIWLSNGTGRDGAHHRNAPKVGWCWANNRHTWLGFASVAGRRPLGARVR